MRITAASDVLVEGTTLDLDGAALDASGKVLSGRTIRWTSSDTSVARVSTTGRVHGRDEGEAVITGSADGRQEELVLRVAPARISLLRSPFEGSYTLVNPFDHRYPRYYDDPDPGFIDWRGIPLLQRLNGHDGYDWLTPTGTPILAAADGYVNFAGEEEPWPCPLLGDRMVSGKYVNLVHTAASGERFTTVYVHLSRIDVEQGQEVAAGEPLGLSGNTGCSTGPHLHFEMGREYYTREDRPGYVAATDPSGWTGTMLDPWLLEPDGAASSRLWIEGEEPPLTPEPPTSADNPGMATAPGDLGSMVRRTGARPRMDAPPPGGRPTGLSSGLGPSSSPSQPHRPHAVIPQE